MAEQSTSEPRIEVRDESASDASQRLDHRLLGPVIFGLAIATSLIHLYFNTVSTLSELWTSALHFGLFGLICALTTPMLKAHSVTGQRAVLGVDVFLGLAALACAAYLMLFENALYERGVNFSKGDWIFSVTAVLLILEFARRTVGWFIPMLCILALSYVAWWGQYVDGIFNFPGLTWETVLFRSYIGGQGMLGSIARISWTYVFMFILFGAFLVKSGAGDFIIELARCAAGRFVGGPGFVAVFSSGLMGSVSGSSVANTVSTGVITIPLMRKAGFPARFAAGVEAAASTGGQLMPPVMGAGAFIMASYTQVSYLTIISVAALPALLYFLSVAMFVRIEAKRSHAVKLDDADAPSLKEVLKDGWHFLLPLVVLVAALIYGFTPTYAAGIAILSVIVASWVSKYPMGPKDILEALVMGSRNITTTAILLITVGLIVMVVSTTGIGNTFSIMITDWAGGSLLITIVLVALASLILGMGLPVTAAYIVLATLSAPAIYNLIAESQLLELVMNGKLPEQAKSIFMLAAPDKMELLNAPMDLASAKQLLALVPDTFSNQLLEQALSPATLSMALVAAHMVIFWLSQDSNVTPPVCLTAFAAAAIAGTPQMRTGFTAWKLAKGLYIVPLLFAYSPLITGEFDQMLQVFCFALFGVYAIVAGLEGYLEHPLNPLVRLLMFPIGVLMLWPHGQIMLDVAGLLIFIVAFAWSSRQGSRVANPATA
ncbi:TRAP transporter permease [Marinobacter sp. M216]|uniref:TRAP transporter permease n=1 Tax=Marinobacter albus TaxID=3030833 RepID=A0ABT7HBV1_9GAMM|nr:MULTISPECIES: TRAP transporter permease [unclassified Marinobacter]MBW7470256.1 TRAP transporter permease [Marinobacter sp. F4218]MDK9557479.1 TRAP transporter permease [Marinobacter sp. M216]